MTDDLMNKAKDQMNVLERVVAGVPGYKGYKEKELRRETDKTLRTVLTRQIEDQKARLTGLQVELISGGQLGLMDDMERCATKMQILADSIRTASYGYAPLFDDVRVKEEELDAWRSSTRASPLGSSASRPLSTPWAPWPAGRTRIGWSRSVP